jgi:hypothetical protein
MWLLDVNMPRQLKLLLDELGIPADTANARGWGTLANGDLLEAAASCGFNCLLTRDRLFGESVAVVLKRYPTFSIVHLTIPLARASHSLPHSEPPGGKSRSGQPREQFSRGLTKTGDRHQIARLKAAERLCLAAQFGACHRFSRQKLTNAAGCPIEGEGE